jgi:N-acetylmuramoyl-L-alanine amidase
MAVWTDKFITVNGYARSGKKLTGVRKIVMHYTANPGATAQNHHDYFQNLNDRYASAHFFVDKNEAICIIPLNEVAYHANDVQKKNADGSAWRGVKELLPNANLLSIGIEMCIEKDGSFHADTLKRAEDVAVELCKKFGLDPATDIVRHRDVTYKNCPAPWVTSAEGFNAFKKNVNAKLHPVVTPAPAPVKPVTPPEPVIAPYIPVSNGVVARVQAKVDVNIRVAPDTKAEVVRVAKTGEKFDVYVNQNDWHNVGGANWIFGNNGQYLALVPKVVLPSGVYNEGDKGDAVKQIQDALNKLGFNCGTADGVWGAKTTSALKTFQAKYALGADGVYGAKSKDKMEDLLN